MPAWLSPDLPAQQADPGTEDHLQAIVTDKLFDEIRNSIKWCGEISIPKTYKFRPDLTHRGEHSQTDCFSLTGIHFEIKER